MSRLVEIVLPRRLGSGFRWLAASSWVSNLGDGFALAAGPLLVASQTRSATLVALALLLQQLPWLLFGLFAGAIADRVNRVLMVATVDLLRTAILVLLGASILTHHVSIGIILVALFMLGTAEVFGITASTTVLPSLVERDDLALANARVQTGFVTVYQLAGPPIGAGLFAASMWLPFIGQAALVGIGAVLISQVKLPAREKVTDPERRLWADISEGFRWVRRNAAVRTLVLTIFTFNITYGAAWSVLVLYAKERLHMGSIGYGLLTTAGAVGGVIGTIGYGWLTKRISLGNIMRIGLIIETFTHLSLALTSAPAVALAIMVVFGAHAFVWGTTSVTVRQRAVPEELQGRVSGVNYVGVYTGLVLGAAIGGPLADRFGITAPFWFGFSGSALFVVLIWKQLRHIAHDDEPREPAPAS